MSWYGGWRPYVSVARRRANATRYAASLAKKRKTPLAPIQISGRRIATTFWGTAWCENLERYSDFSNRLPRGRTYVRNGSVIDLQIAPGKIEALVSGSDVYKIAITIDKLAKAAWSRIRNDCTASIDSMIDLLQARFGEPIMKRLTERDRGLFPQPSQIQMSCSCPDWAGLCKHIAAVLYGVGARLDAAPELLFTLRGVDHLELISQAVASENLDRTLGVDPQSALEGSDLGELFGIELDSGTTPQKKPARRGKSAEPTEGTAAAKPTRKFANKAPKGKGKSPVVTRKKAAKAISATGRRIDPAETTAAETTVAEVAAPVPRRRASRVAAVKRKAR